jgi:hypothetical protein
MSLIRSLIAATLFCVAPALSAHAQSAAPAITVEADGKRKINLSGRERMLSQYMAKAVCFATLGIDQKTQIEEMKIAHHLFARTLVDLRDGSAVQQMLPEEDLGINTALDEVERLWYPYGIAVEKLDLAAVVAQNVPLLTKMNDAVTLFQKKYAAKKVAPEIAAALNISGRQRMLTQKSSKEFCLVISGQDPTGNRTNLKATIALFQASLAGLKDGNEAMGLKTAPNAALQEQIGKVAAAWQPMYEIFARVADGASPTPDEILAISRQNVAVMETANAMTFLYEKAATQ